ncbi:membrane protein [Agarivorans sp. OAG1]|uniref:DUF3302 domain-containing protein n=1 Tax=unclassified Agarivorans TaxID=2636026 RepID=UPI00128D7507|nr:DUF3302 domain-containing protein [Agarivorans sp. B2Z047]MPW30189.1 DUF3302 domain-containing protein [Agarivorans sp. B2Z047]UQN43182.1 DUF3302 domain-containing protein [Agarivorans sp. B2Z047]BEU01490.1 membrane protein [Agarivorans sp. OAG1]
MFLDFFALGLLFFVGLTLFYGIIAIHDIPYEISKHRNHPHQDAIHVAGWISLFTLHAIWPFLWIWATLYREDRGWGFKQLQQQEQELEQKEQQLEDQNEELSAEITKLKRQVAIISKHVQQLEQQQGNQ